MATRKKAPAPTATPTDIVPTPVDSAPVATPAAEKLAADAGVDLASVTPTGATGIVVDDVQAAADALAARKTLRKGTYTVDAPGLLGGAKVTLRAGEPVGVAMQAHIPEADLADLFDSYTPPAV